MSEDLAAVVADLRAIADTLADLALDRLRRASDDVGANGEVDPALLAEEKLVTRARRAVEKAADLLDR